MANGTLLGCPHCGKPIAFAAELAGKLAACPHCRGPFQMPAAPPVAPQPAAPPQPQPQPPVRKAAPNLGFDPNEPAEPKPGERRGKEPLCYPRAESVSLLVCISGIVFTLMVVGILIIDVIVPQFRLPGTREFFSAFMGSVGVLTMLIGGCGVSLLTRHLVLVVVDAARNVRPDGGRVK